MNISLPSALKRLRRAPTQAAPGCRPRLDRLEDRALLAAPFAVGGDPGVRPADFRVTTFATGLNFPKSMQRLADGSLLVGTSDPRPGGDYFNSTGSLVRLVDADDDGQADGPGAVLFSGLPGVVTSVRQAGALLFVTSTEAGNERISVLRAGADPASPYTLVGGIDFAFPGGDWEHTTYALAVRPTPGQAGRYDLFFNVGSFENNADSTATVTVTGLVNASLNGDSIYMVTVRDGGGTPSFSNLTQVATGLRNAAGLAFDPATGDLLFEDNGIDGLVDANEPRSADELNRIAAADIGGRRRGFRLRRQLRRVPDGAARWAAGGSTRWSPSSPCRIRSTGSESEGPAEIAMAPAGFPEGLNSGVFVGFHGKFNQGGIANEENPLVYYDFASGTYFHFVGNNERNIGHLDGLLSAGDSLFVADLSSTGSIFSAADAGKGVIYQIRAIPRGNGNGGGGNGGGSVEPPVVIPIPVPTPTPTRPTTPTVPVNPTRPTVPTTPTPPVVEQQPATGAMKGPRVQGVYRSRTGRNRTALMVTFDEALDPSLASNPANYVIIAEGRGGGWRVVPITSASYDSNLWSVKLVTGRRLELSRRVQLTIRASSPSGVADTGGRLLDGDGDGMAGGDFTGRFRRFGRA